MMSGSPPEYRAHNTPESGEIRVAEVDNTASASRLRHRSRSNLVSTNRTSLILQPQGSVHEQSASALSQSTLPRVGESTPLLGAPGTHVAGKVSVAARHDTTSNVNPTNHVDLSRASTRRSRLFFLCPFSTGIRGVYTIDPYLQVPTSLFVTPTPGPPAARPNLRLKAENGGINVDISLIGEVPPSSLGGVVPPTTIKLAVKSQKSPNSPEFPLFARLHTPVLPRPPFVLKANGSRGYLSVHLPLSFYGPVYVTTQTGNLDTHISPSRAFGMNSIILNETAVTRVFFVGELRGLDDALQAWDGDKVEIEVNGGRVRLQIEGEPDWDSWRAFWWRPFL